MSADLQVLQNKLEEVLSRVQRLEEQIGPLTAESARWRYLVTRPHPWRCQLAMKGRNMTVGQLMSTIRANRLSPDQASQDLELPLEAIHEAMTYYTENRPLIELEAAEERRRSLNEGIRLSLNLYLDDCAYAKALVQLLRAAGHRVVTPMEAGTSGRADEVHLQFAASQNLILLTKNPDDFAQLHEASSEHAGIFVIYQDNDPDRDMTYAEIVRAIGNLQRAGITLSKSFQVLNAWRY